MVAYDPRSLITELHDLIRDANRVASLMLKNNQGIFVTDPRPEINFSLPEMGFLQVIHWLYVLYNKNGPVGVGFLSELFPAYQLDEEGVGKQHVSIVRYMRTRMQHQLDPAEDINSRVQEICEQWFERHCRTQVPREPTQWEQCFIGILSEAISFLATLRDCVRKIEQDESRNQILSNWELRLKRYHSPLLFDDLISIVAADIGQENVDAISLRKKHYDTWARKLQLHQGNYEFAIEGRKLIEHVLLNEMTPTLPITGKDLMETFSLPPGPILGTLLREARMLYEATPCSRDDLLERLKKNVHIINNIPMTEISKGGFAMNSPSIPVYVAFQGGGPLGMAHLGAWQVLAQRFKIVGVAGTSAGSIVAAFCAAGYDPYHAIDLFGTLEWPEFVKPQHWLDLFRKRDGWSDGDRFYQWMKDRLAAHVSQPLPRVTFASLYQETGIYLAIIACDLNNETADPILFDMKNEANTTVAFAVRASISIPGLFTAVPREPSGQVLVDGGLVLNLPLEPLVPLAQSKHCPLIGVRFKQPMAYLEAPDVSNILKRSLKILMTPNSIPSSEVMQASDYIDIVIDVEGFNSRNFSLTAQEKQQLVQRGAQAAREALMQYDLSLSHSGGYFDNKENFDKEEVEDSERRQIISEGRVTSQTISSDEEEHNKIGQVKVSQNLSKLLSPKDRQTLAKGLLKCPCVKDHNDWERVVADLPASVHSARKSGQSHHADVLTIIEACENHEALKDLIDTVRYYDGETFQMRDLDDVIRQVLPGLLES